MTPEELIAIRRTLGMERWELGEAVGYTGANARDTVGKWERGQKRIPEYRAAMIVTFFLATMKAIGRQTVHLEEI